MALVNPNIAMSFRQPEFRPRNALAEYAQVQQIVGGQRQAEVAEMQLEDLRRERGVLGQIAAAISAKDGPDLKTASLLMMQNPKTSEQGYNIYQALQRQKRLEDYERQYSGEGTAAPAAAPAAAAPAPQGKLVAAPIRPIPSPVTAPAAADAPAPAGETNLAYLQRQFGTPGGAAPTPAAPNALAPAAAPTTNAMLASAAGAAPDVNALMRRYNLASRAGSPDAAVILKQVEAALRGNKMSDRFVPVGNLVFDRQTEQFITPTEAQLALTRPQQARAPVAVLQNGRPVYVSPEQAVGQTPFTPASVQVLGMGPGREAPAPTITQIQDPTDPSKMITIDARRYQGGGVGSPGVIGASGKTPAATAAAMKKEEGATQAKDILDTLRTAYDTLDQARAVPSQQRNALSNALSYVAGTGVGQVAGRVVGTEAQTQRDIIASARNQMLNAIKNATGMSAQQLNSNVEFRSWLEALTDPTRSIEANRAILDNMEKFIASGGKYSAKGGGQAAPAAAPAGGATGGNLSPAEQAELDQLRARFGKNKP